MVRQRSEESRAADERARWLSAGRSRGAAFTAAALSAAILLGSAGTLSADKVIWKDGTEVTGRIVSRDDKSIVLAMPEYGPDVRVTIPLAEVQAVIQDGPGAQTPAAPAATSTPAPGEKRYYPLPIVGEIGTEVTADTFKVAFGDAVKAKPDYIVLYVDSPGGSVAETRQILEIIAEAEDVKLVAFVKQALSAAAIISLTCPDIYMSPSAVIGGAVPYQVAKDGTPKAVAEKFQSIIRAQFRAAAELGGHPTVLVEAMMDTNMELFLTSSKDGKKGLAAKGPGQLLKGKNKVLAMTAGEAIACGIAKGKARKLASAHKAMGLASWSRVPGKGWDIMANRAHVARREEMLAEQREDVVAQRKDVDPELKKVEDQLTQVAKRLRQAKTEMAMMEGEYAREIAAANNEYEYQRKEATRLGIKGEVEKRQQVLRRAELNLERKMFSLRKSFEPRVRSMTLRVQGYLEQQKELMDKRRNLRKLGGK